VSRQARLFKGHTLNPVVHRTALLTKRRELGEEEGREERVTHVLPVVTYQSLTGSAPFSFLGCQLEGRGRGKGKKKGKGGEEGRTADAQKDRTAVICRLVGLMAEKVIYLSSKKKKKEKNKRKRPAVRSGPVWGGPRDQNQRYSGGGWENRRKGKREKGGKEKGKNEGAAPDRFICSIGRTWVPRPAEGEKGGKRKGGGGKGGGE